MTRFWINFHWVHSKSKDWNKQENQTA